MRYETAQDRENEERVAKAILAAGRRINRYKKAHDHRLDYIFYKTERPIIVAEIKCRSHRFGHFDSYMISQEKWDFGLAHGKKLGVPFFIFVKFVEDGIYYLDATRAHSLEFKMGGRKDRNDPKDYEPCVYIPINQFTRMDHQ